MPDVGQTIAHFQLLEKLGEGGMGVAYKARDLKLHRTVVIKSLPERLSSDPTEQARLLAEARAAAALNHPGICSVNDVLDHDGRKFIVMEFVEGKSLRSLMLAGVMDTSEILSYAIQVADALAHAHERGIIHRDVKPENILISPGGRVKVMDFGLARQRGRTQLTREGAVLGTVAYMSPEQARGEGVDQRTDIWSLGAILYEASTGSCPFPSSYDQAVIYGILNEDPTSPRSVNPAIPQALEEAIVRCLSKSPDDRYASMEELRERLMSIRSDLHPSIIGGARLTGARRRKGKVAALLLAAAVVLVLSVVGYLWVRSGSQTTEGRSSIAVLPFKNLSNREEDAYFAEGLTEDVISHLGTIPGLKVIGRGSVMRYRETQKSYSEIGGELGVETLLDGSVRHVGERVRVVAHLVDHTTGEDLWSETYDRNLQDILAIQRELANQISGALNIRIHRRSGLSEIKQLDLQAWRPYQQGKTEWYKRTFEGTKAAIRYFEKALEVDPDFALARAGLADALARLGDTGVIAVRPAEAFAEAEKEALKAISLDQNLADGHASLGHVQMHHFQWAQAERSLLLALELNPNYPVAQTYLCLYYACVGRQERSRECAQNALLVDPLSGFTTSTAALALLRVGSADSAKSLMERMLQIDPSSPRLHFTLGRIYAATGHPAEALREYEIVRTSENNTEVRSAIAQAHALAGQPRKALALVDSLIDNIGREFVDPVRIAEVYAALGRKDETLDWLEKALREDSAGIIFLKADPWYAKLRSEPRYRTILSEMGIGDEVGY